MLQTTATPPSKSEQHLKWLDTRDAAGKGQGFTLTALAAGHTVGGSIWQIVTPAEEHIIYAPDFNHQREVHLNAGSLDGCSPRPAVLICGAKVCVHWVTRGACSHAACVPLWLLCCCPCSLSLFASNLQLSSRAACPQGHPMWAPPRLSRKDREARLTESIKATLRSQGRPATLHASVLGCSVRKPLLCT